jgi:DNA-binding HxlR family transcriptional regulator
MSASDTTTWRVPGEFDCPLREVLDRIGDKWSVLVIAQLGDGPRRYGDLRRGIDGGISQRMLTRTLRGLERDGLVTRTAHLVVPPRVDYELTPLGRTLLGPVDVLAAWATEHRETVRSNRRRYDTEHAPDPPGSDAPEITGA